MVFFGLYRGYIHRKSEYIRHIYTINIHFNWEQTEKFSEQTENFRSGSLGRKLFSRHAPKLYEFQFWPWWMRKYAQLKDLVFLIVTVPKIFKIGQKLTKIWPKNRFFKSIDIENPFSGQILVNFCPILKNLVPLWSGKPDL